MKRERPYARQPHFSGGAFPLLFGAPGDSHSGNGAVRRVVVVIKAIVGNASCGAFSGDHGFTASPESRMAFW